MIFTKDDLDPTTIQTIHCSTCSTCLVLELNKFEQIIEDIEIKIEQLPILICPSCDKKYLPQKTRLFLKWVVKEGKKKSETKFYSPKHSLDKRYNFCENVNFLYEATDYNYIPGLMRPWNDGALTPVFFKKTVLHKFLSDDDYTVTLGSNTYGTIYHPHGYISFGINRNGKVIAWLKDLDKLPLEEQHYFRSSNVKSDHDICSQFYDAQIEVKWPVQSQERLLLMKKEEFEKGCKENFNLKISRYTDDIDEVLEKIQRPVFWNEKNVMYVINSLNKITTESFNSIEIKKEIEKLDSDFETMGLGSLKLLQKLIQLKFPELDAEEIVKSFFVLNDFRLVLDHRIDNPEKVLDSCYERMGITENKDLETLYDTIFKGMTNSYTKLNEKFS